MTYFSYYLIFPILGLILYFRRDREVCGEFVFTLCSTFYVFYLMFISLPVLGAETIGLPPSALDGPFTRIMKAIFDNFEKGGAAFPSSHVGIAVLVLIFAFRHLSRKVAWVFAVFCVSLSFATVYCRYHYAIDAIAGLITGIVLTYLFSAIAVRNRSKAALQQLR
jgi:membrane-associated phospholipid phosphatase